VNQDLVLQALSRPVDWTHFERLASEVLALDDLPGLRAIGGVGDQGQDAVEERFFTGELEARTVVQVTNERAQKGKLRSTIATLRENGIAFSRLVFVTGHPISSSVRKEMQEAATELGVALDIRDQQYMVKELARPSSRLFARYFGTVGDQVRALLGGSDPLQVLDTSLRRAMLGTLAAYVLHPRARLARQTLFDKTVLAALVDASRPMTEAELIGPLRYLLPGEDLTAGRIRAALGGMVGRGEAVHDGHAFAASEHSAAQIGVAISAGQAGFEALLAHVQNACGRVMRLDDATRGYLEVNLRRALLAVLRASGPLSESGNDDVPAGADLVSIVSRGLPEPVARTALSAMGAFLQTTEGRAAIAPLGRAYAGLAIRNLDPVGRRWQAAVLARTTMVLDTDAALLLLIEELPGHEALVRALRAFHDSDVRTVVPQAVLEEVVIHVANASSTFRRFADALQRLPESAVESQVWNAVVRGYYYACQAAPKLQAEDYWSQYYDRNRAGEYIRFQLGQRLPVSIEDVACEKPEWVQDLDALAAFLLARRERKRLKSQFRSDAEMEQRARQDVSMALRMAELGTPAAGGEARGYLVTSDGALRWLEHQDAWGLRPKVVVSTTVVPDLAGFVCGLDLDDDQVVQLLFDPVLSSAAELLKEEIGDLTAIGVELRNVKLDKLEWDLSNGLRDSIHLAVAAAERSEEGGLISAEVISGLEAVRAEARRLGYPINEELSAATHRYQAAVTEAGVAREESAELREKLRILKQEMMRSPKKTRRRWNRLLRELGLSSSAEEDETSPSREA